MCWITDESDPTYILQIQLSLVRGWIRSHVSIILKSINMCWNTGFSCKRKSQPPSSATPSKSLLKQSSLLYQIWEVHLIDMHNAFFHSDLDEEVFMQLLPGFRTNDKKVCCLHKSLYGLKQTPRCWFEKHTKALKDYGFEQNTYDYSLFIYATGQTTLHVLVYVDDLIITRNSRTVINELKSYFSSSAHIFTWKTLYSAIFLGHWSCQESIRHLSMPTQVCAWNIRRNRIACRHPLCNTPIPLQCSHISTFRQSGFDDGNQTRSHNLNQDNNVILEKWNSTFMELWKLIGPRNITFMELWKLQVFWNIS